MLRSIPVYQMKGLHNELYDNCGANGIVPCKGFYNYTFACKCCNLILHDTLNVSTFLDDKIKVHDVIA